MNKYEVKVKIDQICTKEMWLHVLANNKSEAEDIVRQACSDDFPNGIEQEGVIRMLTTNIKFWIPRDITVSSIERVVDAQS